MLFVLLVNDLPDNINNITKFYADDLKLIADASDRVTVENDLLSLEQWESIWLLKFNPKKCKVMHVSYNSNLKNVYELDGVVLKNIQSEKDLGVTVNHDA